MGELKDGVIAMSMVMFSIAISFWAANHGFSPNEDSIFFKEYGFKVNLKLIDDPVVARDAFAAGESHILWGTLDMMVLFAPELMKDSRTAPRIFQQVDWSNGGDGIVVRGDIASAQDLRGKTVVYAQNSPSQYFLNNLLLNAGVQPSEVNHKYTASAFEAAAAFVAQPHQLRMVTDRRRWSRCARPTRSARRAQRWLGAPPWCRRPRSDR